jgi:predicted metal-dependent HD superfamily phosphohydrolase
MSNDLQEVIVSKLSNSSAACNVNFDASQRPQLRDFLRAEWDRALQGMECLETDQWFDRLIRQHNQVGRHYHTSVHLKEMLDYLNLLEEGAVVSDQQHKAILRLAVFFHDAVYDPQSNTNEEDSSHLFEQFTREVGSTILGASAVATVITCILATQRHKVIPGEVTMLQELFLDIDMAVLGKKMQAYRAYAALIRKEYHFVPQAVYCKKRAEILESFLASKQIYLTTVMRCALEKNARQNIKDEIESLQQEKIPEDDENLAIRMT